MTEEERKEKKKEYQRRYSHSERGRKAQKRYRESEKGKANIRKYRNSEKFKDNLKKYKESHGDLIKQYRKKYKQTHPESVKATKDKYYSQTVVDTRHRRYTEEELQMILDRKMPDVEIAKACGRTIKAIQIIRSRILSGNNLASYITEMKLNY